MSETSTHRERIEARIRDLKSHLLEIEKTLDQPLDKDLEEQSIDLEDDEVLEGIGRAGQRELHLLEDALERMAKGSYGICQKCGEPIADARLEAVPYAVLCRDCARPK